MKEKYTMEEYCEAILEQLGEINSYLKLWIFAKTGKTIEQLEKEG